MAAAIILVAVLVLSTMAMILTANTARAASHPFRSLRIGVGGAGLQITTTNPLIITLVDEYIVVYNVYSELLTYDKSFNLVGDLAYNWTVAPDGVTWTFHLVHGAYFTDPSNPSDRSHPVTAADVNFTFDMLKAFPGNDFDTYVANVTTARVVDDYTVQLVLSEPLAVMASIVTTVPILPKYIWALIAAQGKLPSGVPAIFAFKNSPPIGSGVMYYDAANTTSTTLVLRRNPNYYGETYYCEIARPDEVRFIGYPNSGSMVSDFISGTNNLDMITGMDQSSYRKALGTYEPKWAVNYGFVGEISINSMTDAQRAYWNTQGNFFTGRNSQILATNLTVRQAIAMSINKSALVKDSLQGLGEVADTLIPSVNPWHYSVPSNLQYHFDPTAARQLLNSQGWKYDSTGKLNPGATPLYQVDNTGKPINGLVFRFYTLNSDIQWQIAATDIEHWLAQTGIQTTDAQGRTSPGYGLYSINEMGNYWFAADYDMWMWDWVFAPNSDPSLDVLEVETSKAVGPTSDNFYSNATYDALWQQSLKVTDPVARRQIVDQLQLMIYQYASYILPYYRYDLYAATTQSYGRGYAWTNFGNWTQTPGLVPDESPPHAAWYDLAPTDNMPPTVAATASAYGLAGSSTHLSVSTADAEGDPLTYTWDFGDGSATQTTNIAGASHVFAQAGEYTVKIRVSDGEWPVCTTETATIYASGTGNPPPNIGAVQAQLSHHTYEVPNATIPFNLTVEALVNEPVWVNWTFGDQSAGVATRVDDSVNGAVVTANHAYAQPRTYTVSAVATDGKTGPGNHTQWRNLTVSINNPTGPSTGPGAQTNPWLDIGVPVAVVVLIALVAAVVYVRRRKTRRKEEREEEEAEAMTPPAKPPSP
ncbi:MAG TPA: ABC transporter substrate-binding protein [Thermoplasmata archaeon]|nr:ABC transporter substrate-binding protein [Thermoplasmata archaeon]